MNPRLFQNFMQQQVADAASSQPIPPTQSAEPDRRMSSTRMLLLGVIAVGCVFLLNRKA